MKYILKTFVCLCFVFLLCNLTGCGKVAEPSPYENSGYPHAYPRY